MFSANRNILKFLFEIKHVDETGLVDVTKMQVDGTIDLATARRYTVVEEGVIVAELAIDNKSIYHAELERYLNELELKVEPFMS